MKDRKGDPRIYIITLFFFLCITCGGLFLGLYIFLPETHSQSWYPIVGFVLVGIPWLFWVCAYIVKCFSPIPTHPNVYAARTPSKVDTPGSPPKPVTPPAAVEEKSPCAQSPSTSSPGRRVHFGAVVVLGDNEDENKVIKQEEDDRGRESADPQNKASVHPKESEIPLAYSS